MAVSEEGNRLPDRAYGPARRDGRDDQGEDHQDREHLPNRLPGVRLHLEGVREVHPHHEPTRGHHHPVQDDEEDSVRHEETTQEETPDQEIDHSSTQVERCISPDAKAKTKRRGPRRYTKNQYLSIQKNAQTPIKIGL